MKLYFEHNTFLARHHVGEPLASWITRQPFWRKTQKSEDSYQCSHRGNRSSVILVVKLLQKELFNKIPITILVIEPSGVVKKRLIGFSSFGS